MSGENNKAHDLIAEIWKKSSPAAIERAEKIVISVRAWQESCDEAERAAAREESHKLAGALGSFGWARGSEVAAELERELKANVPNKNAALQLARSLLEEVKQSV